MGGLRCLFDLSVIAGLDPAIHHLEKLFLRRVMDTRVKPAYDDLCVDALAGA
jgi:hypothetical protein